MSNADSRSPSTDALDTLGMIHFKQEKRDAIHLAVEPVKASRAFLPAQKIGIINGVAYPVGFVLNGVTVPYHGIVDPFLTGYGVDEGQNFWFVMKPREVQSLRHVWEHPEFPAGT